MTWPITLETERLVLRPWNEGDAEALFEYASDPDVGPAAGWLPHKSVEESAQVIRDILCRPETYAITVRDSPTPNKAAGSISLYIGEESDLAIGSDQGELGYWIGKPLWGNGYMPEAVRELMRHAFCDLGLVAIWAGHAENNVQSRRVQEKVGLKRQRSIKNRPRKIVGDYETEDVNWITREEWEVLQKADPVGSVYVEAQLEEAADISAAIPRIARIRSGGQTGADRGALDGARVSGVPICGWCPPGGLAEDMPEPPGLLERYPELVEGTAEGYVERTAWNVRDAHATLIVAPAGIEPKSGTEMTVVFAKDYGRPYLVVRSTAEVDTVRAWLEGLGRGITLNVAGPRESKTPGTYATTKQIVEAILAGA